MMPSATKFQEITHDYDRELEDYERAVRREYDRSLKLYDTQPEDEEEVIYVRKLHRPFARRVLDFLMVSFLNGPGGRPLECREAIKCLDEATVSGSQRIRATFPESVFMWLREQKAGLRKYLNGRYEDEIHRFLD